jgi:hypothetical protein
MEKKIQSINSITFILSIFYKKFKLIEASYEKLGNIRLLSEYFYPFSFSFYPTVIPFLSLSIPSFSIFISFTLDVFLGERERFPLTLLDVSYISLTRCIFYRQKTYLSQKRFLWEEKEEEEEEEEEEGREKEK